MPASGGLPGPPAPISTSATVSKWENYVHRPLVLSLVVLLGCYGETPSRPPGRNQIDIPSASAGCYSIRRDDGAPWSAKGPQTVELSMTRVAEAGTDRYEVKVGRSPLPFSFWRPLSGGRVELNLGDGFSNSAFALTKNGDRLHGTVQTSGDVATGVDRRVPITLTRIACP